MTARPDPRAARAAFVNGRVLTIDDAQPDATAVAIEADRIVAVGADRDVRRAAGAGARLVDLAGRTVTPGLIDGHAHLDREGLRDRYPSLEDARSIDEICRTIRSIADRTPAGEWIVTMPIGRPPFYFDQAPGLAEGRYPDRHDLDRAAPDHPVYIRGIWGYWDRPPIVSIANSAALARCGIGRDTQPPCESVEIVRDPDTGEPTGVFREHDPLPILEFTLFADVPRFTHTDRVRGIRIAMQRYHSAGVTGTYEGHGVSPDVEAAYAELHAAGSLTMRCRLVLSPDWSTVDEAIDALRGRYARAAGRGSGDAWLRAAGVFLGIGRRGCVAETLHAGLPYTAWAGFAEWEHPLEEWEPIARAAAEAGVRIHTLINDEAVLAAALDVLERIDASVPLRGQRVVLEHLRWSTRPLLERIRALGALVTTQPAGYLWKAGSAILDGSRDPEQYVSHALLAELGIPFALSTDDKPFDSRWSLWAAVARTERYADRVVGAAQRLTVRRALRAMTLDAARLSFDEDERGSIAPGKQADLVVFDEDPEAVPSARLRDLPVAATIVGGRVVHAAGSLAGLDGPAGLGAPT